MVCSSIWEGLAAVRIADFLNIQLKDIGEEFSITGCCIVIDTGQQCTVAGVGQMFEEFQRSGMLKGYTGFGSAPTQFFDRKNYHTAPYRLMKFDETYYKMPYDCRTHEIFSIYFVFLCVSL